MRRKLTNVEVLCLLASGLGIGWLIGLSVSPVVQGVITGLITAAIAVASVMVGIQPTPGSATLPAISPAPMALLILGVAVSAPVGVIARTHGWLEPINADAMVPGTAGKAEAGKSTDNARKGGLFGAIAPDECKSLRGSSDAELYDVMATSTDAKVAAMAKICGQDDRIKRLRAAVEYLCPKEP